MKRFALVDCNNFFVSCERIFNPKLVGKPVVVLSSNDACVIARSNEAKALGIKMGQPAFECIELFKKYNVIVHSSNFPLYGDISSRVMQSLTQYSTDIEIYSVDEAFLYLPKYKDIPDYFSLYCQFIKKKVKQQTGIPVSIGIGSTKTLAKIANHIAKKNPQYNNVFDITEVTNIDGILKNIKVEDIWGIGYRYSKLLNNNRIYNVYEFKNLDDKWVKKNLRITGLKTLLELRGISCLSLEEIPAKKKSICVSRAFGRNVTDINELKQSLSLHISTAAEKLRKQNSICSVISIFVCYANYMDPQRYYNSFTIQLDTATSYTPTLITNAMRSLEKIYKTSVNYKKIGVILDDFCDQSFNQLNLFSDKQVDLSKQSSIMKTVDKINNKLGRHKVFFAVSSKNKNHSWENKKEKKSPSYTTSWNEILTIKI